MAVLVILILIVVVIIVNSKLGKANKELARLKPLEPYISYPDLKAEFNRVQQELVAVKAELENLTAEETLYDVGFYSARYSFETSELYREKLLKVRAIQKELLKERLAVHVSSNFSFNGSEKEGRKITDSVVKLALLAFNEECESIVSKVKFGNVQRYMDLMNKAFATVNKFVERWGIAITEHYLKNRIEELQLVYEYQEKVEEEKEEQRRIKEEMKEEERVRREIEKAKEDAEKDEQRSREALERARQELSGKQGAELDALNAKMAELERQLAEATAKKERALSQAQLTKSGHVYIISNIGSFGHDVYKIGMTRRLEPMDRVRELGDASVPFEFDVHAIIYSENAPELENALHRKFEGHRVNKVNQKKEFFRVKLEDIEQVVLSKQNGSTIEFTKIAKAKEYRETMAMNVSHEKVSLN